MAKHLVADGRVSHGLQQARIFGAFLGTDLLWSGCWAAQNHKNEVSSWLTFAVRAADGVGFRQKCKITEGLWSALFRRKKWKINKLMRTSRLKANGYSRIDSKIDERRRQARGHQRIGWKHCRRRWSSRRLGIVYRWHPKRDIRWASHRSRGRVNRIDLGVFAVRTNRMGVLENWPSHQAHRLRQVLTNHSVSSSFSFCRRQRPRDHCQDALGALRSDYPPNLGRVCLRDCHQKQPNQRSAWRNEVFFNWDMVQVPTAVIYSLVVIVFDLLLFDGNAFGFLGAMDVIVWNFVFVEMLASLSLLTQLRQCFAHLFQAVGGGQARNDVIF